MINKDRIVPIQKVDLLTMIGIILKLTAVEYAILEAKDVLGTFEVTDTGAAGNKLANQPVKSLDFGADVTGGTVYFVASFDYEGITVAGAAATIADGSDDVINDGSTLYKAVLASGEVTITAISPVITE